MLTKISALTAAVAAVLNLVVLFGVSLEERQIAGINVAIVAIGTLIHIWNNPSIPFIGVSENKSG